MNRNAVSSKSIDNQTTKKPLQSLQDARFWLTIEVVQFYHNI